MLFRQLFKSPDRLLAIGGVVIDKSNLLAFDVATFLFEDVVDHGRCR